MKTFLGITVKQYICMFLMGVLAGEIMTDSEKIGAEKLLNWAKAEAAKEEQTENKEEE